MNRFSRHELFSFSHPVRPDFPQGPDYARRRVITVIVLLLVLGAAAYALWGPSRPTDPADIPTIKAEGEYKQKPSDPGGIDIPHQDVRVYDQLEGKNAPAPMVEHLLPPPEMPNEVPLPPVAAAQSAPADLTPPRTQKTDALLNAQAAKRVDTTVEKAQASPVVTPPVLAETPKTPAVSASVKAVDLPKAAAPAPVKVPEASKIDKPAVKAETSSVEKVIEKINAKTQTGNTVIQMASSSNEAQARALMEQLQKKYASQLGSVKLRVTRDDLGSKGVFYRIQSETLAKDEAGRLCSSLKKLHAGCILVGK